MGNALQVQDAPRVEASESFSSGEVKRLRLTLSESSELKYALCEMKGEAGVRSRDPRVDEGTKYTKVCAYAKCGRIFTQTPGRAGMGGREPPARRLTRATHDARGMAIHDAPTNDPDDLRNRPIVRIEGRRYCRAACERADRFVGRDRSPAVPAGASVREVVCLDGKKRRVYEGVHPRTLPRGPRPLDEEMECGTGQSGAPRELYAPEAFVNRPDPRGRRAGAWACLNALRFMEDKGQARLVAALVRVYGVLDASAPYRLWGKGSGLSLWDPQEVAPLAYMTPEVEAWRARLVADRVAARIARMEAGDIPESEARAAAREEQMKWRRRAIRELHKQIAKAPPGMARERLEEALRDCRAELRRGNVIDDAAFWKTTTPVADIVTGDARDRLQRSVDRGTTAAEGLDHLLRTLSAGQRPDGETPKSFKERQREKDEERRSRLYRIAVEADALLIQATIAYRAARRCV